MLSSWYIAGVIKFAGTIRKHRHISRCVHGKNVIIIEIIHFPEHIDSIGDRNSRMNNRRKPSNERTYRFGEFMVKSQHTVKQGFFRSAPGSSTVTPVQLSVA